MKKLVLCEFAGRRKKVVFETESGKSDVSSLKKALINAAVTDEDLQKRMANSTLVFQHVNLELCPQPIDIEEDDIIEDKSIVAIVFTPAVFFDVPVINLCGTTLKKGFLDTDIDNNCCDTKTDTANINNSSVEIEHEASSSSVKIEHEASSKTDITTLQSSDMSEKTFKAQFSEMSTEISEAKSSEVAIKVCKSG